MRPIKLSVEGFTAFRAKQEISFEALELFAISGPTGSGKSSILDAMMYALFGEIPRLGGQGYQDIISHGAPRLAVTLEFELRHRFYRAVRTLRRRKQASASAQLAEIDPASGHEIRPIADSAREVDRCIEDMLGLDYDTFAQAVVLPQGQFQRFLKAPPRQRRELLSSLLRLGRYDRLRKAAQKLHEDASNEASTLERRLVEDFAGVNEDTVAAMVTELEARERAIADLRSSADHAARILEETRQVVRDTEALERATAENAALGARGEEMDRDRARLVAARQAAGLRDLLQSLGRARDVATAAARRRATAHAELETATRAHEIATTALANAAAAAEALPALTAKIGELDQVIGIQSALAAAEKRLDGALNEVTNAERNASALRNDLATARLHASATEEKAREALLALEATGYSSERASLLREIAPAARALLDHRARCDEIRVELEQAEKVLATREDARATAARTAATTRETLESATAERQCAEEKLRGEERRNHAACLRRELRPGDSCPVCEQSVSSLPVSPDVEGALDQATSALDDARSREAAVRKAAEGATGELARADAALHAARERVADVSVRIATTQRMSDELLATLIAHVRGAAIEPALPADPAMILEQEADMARRLINWERAQKLHRDAERVHEGALSMLRRLEADVSSVAATFDSAQRRVDDARSARDEQRDRVRAVVGDGDPRAMKAELQERSSVLTRHLEHARRDVADAESALRLARKEDDDASSQEASASAHLAELESSVVVRANAAGFASEDEARAAALTDEAMEGLDQNLRAYDANREILMREIAALVETLAGRRASYSELAVRQREKHAAEQAHTREVEARAALSARLETARDRLARVNTLRAELGKARSDAEVHGTLAKELQTDRFLEYLLSETQQKLVVGASLRLRDLSDRYTLEVRDGQYYVVDHDNAGEQRSVDTLSGGETFLTSLALALELSSQIQATAGATQLGSIFIDEGFGTLDPETLDTVASAIESLPHTGRMVGIVTHVAELTERMPAKIYVAKSPDGSRVRVGHDDRESR